MTTRFFEIIGPVVLSALSILVTFCVLQPIALSLDPSFSLLSSRSVGKIAFTTIVLTHIILLLLTTSRSFLQKFWGTNVRFITTSQWIAPFLFFFTLFFGLHAALLIMLSWSGITQLHSVSLSEIMSKSPSLLIGFIATFFLAWTEETIFRGTLFPFLRQKISILASMFVTSALFMFAHDLTNPLNLVTIHWQLGLGLFLLGFFLNMLFHISQTLYIGMGAHAGLVFVKVVLRRLPLISYTNTMPWWFNVDLRMSFIAHFLFFISIGTVFIIFQRHLTKQR